MAEVLSILGIAMKEIKQGRMKKIAKKLIGRTEIEDALKRLDKLTQEEVRMATAQNPKVTHTVDKGVREVVDTVIAMNDRIASVDNTVKGVDAKVVSVDDRVKVVDNKVTEVISGA
ncbi:hypothetical protein F5888DRAFT_1635038 [Russula emetica]|nr:hypothetical protein F5888DRAFT_1635038 [Russula emetica]